MNMKKKYKRKINVVCGGFKGILLELREHVKEYEKVIKQVSNLWSLK